MALNIVAKRKLSLEGFAEGWGSSYLEIRAINEEKRLELGGLLDGVDLSTMENVNKLRTIAAEVILGGSVMSTDDEGNVSPAKFSADDSESLKAVVNALNGWWLQEVLFVATGLDRAR